MTDPAPDRLIGDSPAVLALRREVSRAARSDAKVLITGESGVGKEVTARLIHQQSTRRQGPFVAINCAGVPETLLESELFGHTRGSFTGAYRDRPGMLESAHRGSVFLDEVGEMSLRMQGLLLRFLESGEIQRVGGQPTGGAVDGRVIAATNRSLARDLAAKTFREDLYYRLNVIRIAVPPLRERSEDIPALFESFLAAFAERYRRERPRLSPEALAALTAHSWPGNVRELRNVAERLAVCAHAGPVRPSDLALQPAEGPEDERPVAPRARASEALYERMVVGGESFWGVVYDPFMLRDLTRQELRQIVRKGLEQTRGSYARLLELFNMTPDDDGRFRQFLRRHQCDVPSERLRTSS